MHMAAVLTSVTVPQALPLSPPQPLVHNGTWFEPAFPNPAPPHPRTGRVWCPSRPLSAPTTSSTSCVLELQRSSASSWGALACLALQRLAAFDAWV